MRGISVIHFVDAMANPMLHLKSLKDICVVRGVDEKPVMFAGNQSVIFKVLHEGAYYAMKCCELPHRGLSDELQKALLYITSNSSDFLVESKVYEKELMLLLEEGVIREVDVELRPWVEGKTLDALLSKMMYYGDVEDIDPLVDAFITLALRLLSEDFAHGDLKPENIIIDDMGVMRCIDFGSAYINRLHSSPTKEAGTVGYRHPNRARGYYTKHIDDYPIAVILSTLLIASRAPQLFDRYSSVDDFAIFNPQSVIDGRSEVYNSARELFRDCILESVMLKNMESDTPALFNLEWQLSMLAQKRGMSVGLAAKESFLDSSTQLYGLLSEDGNKIYPAIFKDVARLGEGHFVVNFDGAYDIIDDRVSPLKGFIYRKMVVLSSCRVAVSTDCLRYAIMDEQLNQLSDCIYEQVYEYSGGYAVVKRGGLYGYVNLEGVEVVEPAYTYAWRVENNHFVLQKEKEKIAVDIEEIIRHL